MVTDLFAAIAADMLAVVKTEDFFSKESTERSILLEKELGKTYPKAIKTYLANTTKDAFANDVNQISSIIGSRNSILNNIRDWKTNSAFDALLSTLEEDGSRILRKPLENSSFLNEYLSIITENSSTSDQYRRIMVREAQELLLQAKNIDSAIVQIATKLSEEDLESFEQIIRKSSPDGIQSINVNTSLLGGSRMFKGGKLIDHSWQAKLSTLFSKMR